MGHPGQETLFSDPPDVKMLSHCPIELLKTGPAVSGRIACWQASRLDIV